MATSYPRDKDNFTWMLLTIIALLFLSALTEHMLDANNLVLVNFIVTMTLLVAIWSLHTERQWRALRTIGSLVLVAMMFGDLLVDRFQLELFNLSLLVFLLTIATISTGRQVMFPARIDGNIVVGAMVLYLLMGLLWAIAYLLVEEFSPGSMRGLEGENWQANLQTVIYYSFVTISTLGYGDLVPQQPVTQFLAYMEAITGQFYLSVLVASLVSASFGNSKD